MISDKKPIDSKTDKNVVYDLSAGIVLPLDRTMPKSVTHYNEYSFETHDIKPKWEEFIPTDHVLRKECLTYPEHANMYYPYALTFTFNATYMKDKPPLEQWELFETKFYQWIALFKKRMIAVQNHRDFLAYEVYPELTKSGTVHAHGLFYYSSNYDATRIVMSKAWVDKTKKDCGTTLTAMKKKTPNGYDYAFDKCHNVTSWRKYITKEHPKYVKQQCLMIVEPSMEMVNMTYEEYLRSISDRMN